MKRTLSIVIALILLLSILPAMSFAENSSLPVAPPPPKDDRPLDPDIAQQDPEPIDYTEEYKKLLDQQKNEEQEEEPEEPDKPVIPEDIWEGPYKDFPGKNGTTTRVFDNGSIYTTYPDGSKEGMDYKGNRFTKDADGKTVAYTTGGDQLIQNADGSEEAISADGTHVYYNEDGSSRSVMTTGAIMEHDANGDLVKVSIEGGESISLVDENGDLIEGEHVITGPDGKKFTFVNNYDAETDTIEFKFWSEGNGKEFGIDGKTVEGNGTGVLLKPNGAKVEMTRDSHENEEGVEEWTFLMKLSNTSTGFTVDLISQTARNEDGTYDTTIDLFDNDEGSIMSFQEKADKNGNMISGSGTFRTEDGETLNFVKNENEFSITGSDGSFLKADLNTGAAEFYDPESGDHIKINENEEVEICHITGEEDSTIDYENGQYVVRDKDGKVVVAIEKNEETGETTVTTEKGDSYTITKDGKVLKNGKEATSDDAEQTESPPQNTDQAEEGSAMPGSDLSIREIAGNYRCEGTQSDNMGDHWETEDSSMSFRFKINDNGQFVWAAGYGEYYEEMILLWDATLGAWTYQDNWDDVANEPSWFTEFGTFTFTKENGTIHLDVLIQQFDNEDGDLETKWVLSGTRED